MTMFIMTGEVLLLFVYSNDVLQFMSKHTCDALHASKSCSSQFQMSFGSTTGSDQAGFGGQLEG